SHQYVYIALSMTPFIVFALIGFIYRYVNTSSNFRDNLPEQILDAQVLTLSSGHPELDSCPVQIDLNGTPLAHRPSESNTNLGIRVSPILPDPPPSYDLATQDLPPSYDQVVGRK